MKDFAFNEAVEEDRVKKAIEHLALLTLKEENIFAITSIKTFKVNQLEKTHQRCDWQQLTIDGDLTKLKVLELEKYLNYHNLPKTGQTTDSTK